MFFKFLLNLSLRTFNLVMIFFSFSKLSNFNDYLFTFKSTGFLNMLRGCFFFLERDLLFDIYLFFLVEFIFRFVESKDFSESFLKKFSIVKAFSKVSYFMLIFKFSLPIYLSVFCSYSIFLKVHL